MSSTPIQIRKAAYSELEELARKHKTLTAKIVVTRARDPKSALHKEFEWDQRRAAEHYWLARAEELIRCYEVVRIAPTGEKVKLRGLVHVKSRKGYRHIDDVAGSPSDVQETLQRLLDEAKTYVERYNEFARLVPHSRIATIVLSEAKTARKRRAA